MNNGRQMYELLTRIVSLVVAVWMMGPVFFDALENVAFLEDLFLLTLLRVFLVICIWYPYGMSRFFFRNRGRYPYLTGRSYIPLLKPDNPKVIRFLAWALLLFPYYWPVFSRWYFHTT